jgi:hypothetical protein
MPLQRASFVPHPVWGKTARQLHDDIRGNNPVSGQSIMPEIVAALTTPRTTEEKQTGRVMQSTGATEIGPDTAENLRQYYEDNGMTDFLPIVLPTHERVTAMLEGTSHRPDEIVGEMSPASGAYEPWSFTVRQVAVNAVMAGARPEYFPVILALAASGASSFSSSTNSFTRMVVINGPILDKIGMNYGIGAMGPFSHANTTIGRAWTLLSKNLGNAGIAGETYMGTLGNATSVTNIVIAENQQENPWRPFHVEKGFKAEESAISVFMGFGIISAQGMVAGGISNEPQFDQQLKGVFATLGPLFGGFAVLDPTVAKNLYEHGYDSKEKLLAYLYQAPGEDKPHFRSPDHINIVVTGGQTNLYYHFGGMRYGSTVSVDKWM